MIVLGIIIAFIVILLLRDLHIQLWTNHSRVKLAEEYDFEAPLWVYLIIVILSLVPVVNVVLFIVFIVFFAVHTAWTHVFSLRGSNRITKALKAIGTFLNKKV